ncbi:MAG: lipopolysaccharide biosynthesis protein [Bdellovibrionota bacterium]
MSNTPHHKNESAIFLKGVGWNSFGLLFRFFRFAYMVLFARMLKAETFGQYVLFFSIIEAISKIATMGLEYGTIKYVHAESARDSKEDNYDALPLIAVLAFLLTLLSTALTLWVSQLLFDQSEVLDEFRQFCYLIPPLSMLNFFSIVSRATLDMRYENIFRNCIETGGILAFGYFFLLFEPNLLALVKAHILASFVATILYISTFFKLTKGFTLNLRYRELFHQSYGMGLVAFANYTRTKADYFLLGKFLSFSQLAVYSMAVLVISLIGKINSAVAPIAGPLLHKIFMENDHEKLQKNLHQMLNFSLDAIFIGGIVLFFFNQDILILYGKSFVLNQHIFVGLLVAQMVLIFFGVPEQYLLFTKHQNVLFSLSAALIVVMAAAFSVLVPMYELKGAIASILVIYLLYGSLLMIELKKRLNLDIFSKKIRNKLMLFSLVFIATALSKEWLGIHRIVACASGVLFYAWWISKTSIKKRL